MAKKTGTIPDDPFELLQISPRAQPEVIEAAYKTLLVLNHPDHNGGDDRMAKALGEAHLKLTDARARARYDRSVGDRSGKVIGEYRILKLLAEGGFGRTYLGEHLLLKEPVCIKHCINISPVDDMILMEEAKAIWNLRHFSLPVMQNLLRLEDGSLALIMSYIPGPTLEQIVKKVKRLDAEHVAWITERILNVLMYLHYHGVVHGDLKPQNIIIQPESHTVVLVDFGLSMVKPSATDGSKGYTPLYAPPEQVRGETLVPESDFYSLGMTMLFALTGDVNRVARREVPESVPVALCDFMRRLLVRDPLKRPNWKKENLFDTFKAVRKESFGRSRSNMKPIPGL